MPRGQLFERGAETQGRANHDVLSLKVDLIYTATNPALTTSPLPLPAESSP